MATTSIGFRWLDLLEKEFDKACVELDTSLLDVSADEPELVFSARQRISTIGSCFAQLTHKALTIFQHSAKLEAELVDMRAELLQARAALAKAQDNPVSEGQTGPLEMHRARMEAAQYSRENAVLRESILSLHSDLFGARLATKYLDKELAGRIQQLQLLGRDMRADIRDSLWAQVEAEILLQRHKTLVRVCRGLTPCPPRPAPSPAHPPTDPAPRTVRVQRSLHLGLGISVTGGREHGVPILISELEGGGPAALTRQLFVGDAILAINDVDLTRACHADAVRALQSVKGDCALRVQFIATDDDDKLSEDNYRFPLYPEEDEVFCQEGDGSGATPTAPRTPEFQHRVASETGSIEELYPLPAPPAPDYNALNNNTSPHIVQMDEHYISVRTAPAAAAPPTYRALPASSSASPASTPVHEPRASKKRVKPHDWRSKGAYRPVQPAPSSSPASPPSPPPHYRDDSPPPTQLVPVEKTQSAPVVPLPPPQEVVLPRIKTKITLPSNPVQAKLLKNKGFRIGSARRVSEPPPLTNGNTNGDKVNYPSHIVTGDGDPDFGTPV